MSDLQNRLRDAWVPCRHCGAANDWTHRPECVTRMSPVSASDPRVIAVTDGIGRGTSDDQVRTLADRFDLPMSDIRRALDADEDCPRHPWIALRRCLVCNG